jgi:hypothetical protein
MAYDTEHVGEIYAVNVPGRQNWEKLSVDEGKKIVSNYRWVYANASCKDLYEAKDEATKLSNALGCRPLVLVYMPKDVFDGTRNEYPGKFQASMHALVERALADRKALLVTARSYGVHQALRAIRRFDSPLILLIGIAPAFGAYGNVWSDNVKQYIKDVRHTRCKYFMIASDLDIHTWQSGGAAARKPLRGDHRVNWAMKKNKSNVDYFVIHGAMHFPIDAYLHHGLVDAMRRGATHWGLQNTPIGDIVYGRDVSIPSSPGIEEPPQENIITDLLILYDRRAGEANIVGFAASGKMVFGKELKGWRKTWDVVAAGDFLGEVESQLVLYDRQAGEANIVGFDASGNMGFGKELQGWRKTWDAIAAGDFLGKGESQLILYDRRAGEANIVGFDTSGKMVFGKELKGWRKTWDAIAAGDFLGKGESQLILYDRRAGEANIVGFDASGKMVFGKELKGWRKTWDVVAAGDFLGEVESQLILYDRQAGEANIVGFDASGKMVFGKELKGWRKTWDAVAAGDFLGKGESQLVLYDRQAGEANIVGFDASGNMGFGKALEGWRKTWDAIAGGPFLVKR